MAMDPGDTGCTHGLSQRIYNAMLANPTGALDVPALKAMCYAIASSVVAEIQANAVLTGNADVAPSLGGLQRSTASGSLTDPIGGLIGVSIPLNGGVS